MLRYEEYIKAKSQKAEKLQQVVVFSSFNELVVFQM